MKVFFLIPMLQVALWADEVPLGPLLPDGNFEATGIGISAEHWDDYFGEDVEGELVDPQRLLGKQDRKHGEEFLQRHAEDSKIALKVMLFQAEQRFPADLPKLLASQLDSDEPLALLLYPMGDPARAELLFSPDLAVQLLDTEPARLVGQSAVPALKKVGELDEFREFCLQMSIRLYWVERSLGWIDESTAGVPEPKPEPVQVKRSDLVKEAFRQAWEVGGLPFIVAMSAFLSFSVLRFLLRSRRRHRFPEFDIEPRLGGDHGAGIGAVLSFGSTTQSPSVQKSQTVDYLGGI